MTKTELIADLGTIFDAVGTPQIAKAADVGIKFYHVRVFQFLGSSGINDRVISFAVLDEGGPGEEARYVSSRPSAQDTSTFRMEVQAALDNAIQNNLLKIKAGWIIKVDEENEKVDVEVKRGDSGAVTQQFAIVYRDGANLGFEWYTIL